MYLLIHWLKYSISLNNGLLVIDNLKIMKNKQGHCWTKGKNFFYLTLFHTLLVNWEMSVVHNKTDLYYLN